MYMTLTLFHFTLCRLSLAHHLLQNCWVAVMRSIIVAARNTDEVNDGLLNERPCSGNMCIFYFNQCVGLKDGCTYPKTCTICFQFSLYRVTMCVWSYLVYYASRIIKLVWLGEITLFNYYVLIICKEISRSIFSIE